MYGVHMRSRLSSNEPGKPPGESALGKSKGQHIDISLVDGTRQNLP